MVVLSDGTTNLTIDIDWGYSDKTEKSISQNRTVGGREAVYFWGTYNIFNVPLVNVPSSDAGLINEWWRDSTQLYFIFDTTTYTTILTNNSQPFQNLKKPYQTEWDGVLQLG